MIHLPTWNWFYLLEKILKTHLKKDQSFEIWFCDAWPSKHSFKNSLFVLWHWIMLKLFNKILTRVTLCIASMDSCPINCLFTTELGDIFLQVHIKVALETNFPTFFASKHRKWFLSGFLLNYHKLWRMTFSSTHQLKQQFSVF